MEKIIWILIAALFSDQTETFGFLSMSESYFLRKFTFDGSNTTCETSSFKMVTLMTCASHSIQVDSSVAFVYNNNESSCCLLDKQWMRPDNFQLEGKGMYDYFEKMLDCKERWEEHTNGWYCFVNEKANWSMAEKTCSLMGAHLVAIESKAENTWLFSRMNYYYEKGYGDRWWSGGTDSASDGSFHWQHSKEGLTFTYWGSSNIDGGRSENCLLLVLFDRWHDYPCSWNYNFICEK